jgi:biotin-dependent carboxylase-like uncharacterized protein
MQARLEVIGAGLGNTLQDAGRFGHRRAGVPWSGFLDQSLAHAANALVGNQPDVACIEVRAAGPSLRVLVGPVWCAVAGLLDCTLVRANGLRDKLPAWRSVELGVGDELRLGVASDACAYVAISGGVDVPQVMGSRSTYARVGLGGIEGRVLSVGDVLTTHIFHPQAQANLCATTDMPRLDGAVRIMLGPQDDYFTDQALADLCSHTWQTSAAQDRMGVRLQGASLQHRQGVAADIVSDGIAPGAIQVPASGEPIVLLADCQTMGGYTKIATVISADLHKMAHLPAGSTCQFELVTAAQAHAALLDNKRLLQQWLQGVKPYVPVGWIDEVALRSTNLISGYVNAQTSSGEIF